MLLASMSFAAVIENWADERQVPRKRKDATLALFRNLSSHIGHDITGNVTAEELVSFKEKHPVESIWAALQPPFSFSWYNGSQFGDQAVVPLVSQSRNNLAL